MHPRKPSPRTDQSLRNLSKALARLEEYLSEPAPRDRDKAGVIQAFEFSFELFWKSFQKLGTDAGARIAGPRPALKFAFESGWIALEEEKGWLEMLDDRNLASHAYHSELAAEIFERVKGRYLSLFQRALERLRE